MSKWAEWIGPPGIVGPVTGRDKGGVIRPSGRRKGLKPFPQFFFCVGLNKPLCGQATWHRVEGWIKVGKSMSVDMVDFGPPDRDQKHVINLEPSIVLVKSNDCDLISHSANNEVDAPMKIERQK